ncbi:MAG: sorbosone dehydrogenase family protein [Gemmatimonadota bacterium]
MKRFSPARCLALGGLSLLSLACTERAHLSIAAGMGPKPVLPAPAKSVVPTVFIAPASFWSDGETPTAAPGFQVRAFASGLDHPRWLYLLPNGDVLVAETNGPERPEDSKGIRGEIFKRVQARAGAGVPSANRISLLRDADGDGIAETRTVLLDSLNSPFGMTLVGNDLYVANTDAILRFPYQEGETEIVDSGVKVVDLPAGPINHHWTKNLIASPDGASLYVTVGSNSNAGENGLEQETNRAAILEVDRASGNWRVFASGLRNPNGLAWQPESGALWTVVNERDELGSDLVPDYLTSVKQGAFYGWPFSYYGQHIDKRPQPANPELVARAIAPDYALGPHTASLGLTFYTAGLFPQKYSGGAFIGQHGSWNRKPRSGYKVVFVPFRGGRPEGMPQDILTDFVDQRGQARGRPVGVIVDRTGALLVADDVGNTIWRVTPGQ